MYSAILFLPLIGFLIAGLFGRSIGAKASEYVTSGLLIIAALLSWITFFGFWLGGAEAEVVNLFRWMQAGELNVSWSIRVDTLTAVMLVVVNSVSALVHVYSIGYMHHDPHRPRFFAYLSLFTFAMLTLVTSDNLMQMFFGLGRCWSCVLPADRFLVQKAVRECGSDEGVCRQPRRRLRLCAWHLWCLLSLWQHRFHHHLPRCTDLH